MTTGHSDGKTHKKKTSKETKETLEVSRVYIIRIDSILECLELECRTQLSELLCGFRIF